MKPLLLAVVALCLAAAQALPEDVKDLSQSKEPIVEAESSEPQTRSERCTTCSGNLKLNLNSPNEILAKLQSIPGAEVHTQQSFEGCSSEKGCAGIKVKDGRVIEKFGDVNSFRSAASQNSGNEFTFHAAGAGGNVFDGGIPNGGPFWWMNQNSPFKAGATGAGGENFEKFSKSSSSFSSSGNAAGAGGAGGAGGASFGASLDLSGNPFLNGDFSKLGAGFSSAGADAKPASSFSSSSFESSSFSSSNKGGEVDIAKNPFLNGGSGFQAQGGFAAGGGAQNSQRGQGQGQGLSGTGFGNQAGFQGQSQFSSTASKFGSNGYTGSSPSPFSVNGNVNLIQNQQKTGEFDFEQQQQQQQTQNIDEAFQGTGNVHAHEHSGGELQQTCAGQGYTCVHKAQCNNGVVNMNGAGILQAKTKKQYCNTKTEICCRIEISTLSGAGGLQGSLGVGGATYSGSGSQGSGLFVSSSQGSQSASGSSGNSGNSGNAGGNAGFGGQNGFESSSSSFESSSNFGSSSRGGNQGGNQGQGTNGFGISGTFGASGSGFNANGASGSSGSGFNAKGASGTSGSGFNANGASGSSNGGTFNSGSAGNNFGGSVNRGVTVESSSSTFESRGTGNFGNNVGLSGNSGNAASSGSSTGKFGGSATFGAGFGSTAAPANSNRFGSSSGNEVTYKQTSQSNFIETDSFSAGSENTGQVYRPGATGLKPGIPYLPPVDGSVAGSSVSSTAYPTTFSTPRPYTPPKPTYLPPVPSTAAPGYLPPQVPEQSINTETRVPNPNYNEGSLILDQSRTTARPFVPAPPINIEVPSGCAAALKCTPIEYCTAEGVISNTTIILTKEQNDYRVPLTDCKDLESGRVGKCCRDPFYTDPWPVNQLGQWIPGAFGNDGKYTPDNRGSGSFNRVQVTPRPDVTGSTQLNSFIPKPTGQPFGPNQVTPGYGITSQGTKNQYEIRGQGQVGVGGQGQIGIGSQGQFGIGGQGQYSQGSQVSTSQTYNRGSIQLDANRQASNQQASIAGGQGQYSVQGQGQAVIQGQGQGVIQGQGQLVSQGQGSRGQYEKQDQFSQTTNTQQKGFGQATIQGQGQSVSQEFGQGVRQGQGQSVSQQFGVDVRQGEGQAVIQGQGQEVSQGFGSGFRQGSGFSVSQGGGFNVENEYSVSEQRVFLQQYSAGGQCGLLNGQKPYGNRNEDEVDFAEIPWQAMVLLQTNKSLLCGGVITRPDVVITSASCLDGLDAKNVLIKGGEWKLGIDDEPLPFQIVQVKNILRHPFYKRGSLVNDAAILVLAENLRFAKNIYPICLPRAGETVDAYYNGAGECIVTGWGKQVLQAHLQGSIMHSLNVSLVNPGECQAKLRSDYPHLLENYDQDSCVCGQPTNPVNNICRVDIGSALACTTGDSHFVLRGIYSWDSGCQLGNQLAAFYKFDLEWYEWAIGLIESARFTQSTSGSKSLSQNRFSGQINSGLGQVGTGSGQIKGQFNAGVKGGQIKAQIGGGQSQFGQFGQFSSSSSASGSSLGGAGLSGLSGALLSATDGQFKGQVGGGSQFGQVGGGSQFGQFSQYSSASEGAKFGGEISAPLTNSFSATYTQKKVFQSEPKIVTYTTKPEIVTFTTKPEYFTYTTKPKIVSYTTKPQVITYETSGSVTNPQYVAPGVTFNPSFSAIVGKGHTHNAQCKCLENGKK